MYGCMYECMSSWGHLEGHLIGFGARKLLTPGWFRNGPDIELGVSGEYPNEVPVGYQ